MRKLKNFTKRLVHNKKGQGMVEYILLLVVVVGIVMFMKGQFESQSGNWFNSMSEKIQGVLNN